jgi:hypothetical protein
VSVRKNNKNLGLSKLFLLKPSLKKGDLGGFALGGLRKISSPLFIKGGIIFTDKL